MSDMFDYLIWRGDLSFSQAPPNSVDALIFSALAYIKYQDIVPEAAGETIPLYEAAAKVELLDDLTGRYRVKKDLELLQAAAQTDRFRNVQIGFYQDIFIPEEETQFAAMNFVLDDGTVFVIYRGTDHSLVGWKEDFNMSFEETIPAQRLALKYLQASAACHHGRMRVGGHSKGGNIAVYAAAKCEVSIQERIIEVYNHDGPGFREYMMSDDGYLRMVPKIYTYIPQSSVFGMLMEHKEPIIIIKSKAIGIMQHDPYSWEVLGKGFILEDDLTPDSIFLDQAVGEWLSGMSNEERNTFVDTIFGIIMLPDISHPKEIMKPQHVISYLKTIHMDEERRKILSTELSKLIEACRKVIRKKENE